MSVFAKKDGSPGAAPAEVPPWARGVADDRAVTAPCGCARQTFFPVRCSARRELEAALRAALGRRDMGESRFVVDRIRRHEAGSGEGEAHPVARLSEVSRG
jgi:hypothetical protein